VNGIEVATSFARSLDLAALSGTVLMVPAQNPLALQAQHRVFVGHYLKSPLDQSPNDPGSRFPVMPTATWRPSSRISCSTG